MSRRTVVQVNIKFASTGGRVGEITIQVNGRKVNLVLMRTSRDNNTGDPDHLALSVVGIFPHRLHLPVPEYRQQTNTVISAAPAPSSNRDDLVAAILDRHVQ